MISTCPSHSANKALYSFHDNRKNIYEITERSVKRNAESIACMIQAQYLFQDINSKSYGWTNKVSKLGERQFKVNNQIYTLNPKAAFFDEHSVGSSTAFLVTDQTVLTAAHCVCKIGEESLDLDRIQQTLIVFNFQMENSNTLKVIDENDVYAIKHVVAYNIKRPMNLFDQCLGYVGLENWVDWALVKLDRKVVSRDPLALDFSGIPSSLPLYMLGHPSGLPLKHTGNAKITSNGNYNFFECNLDAFGGNSGSPVFRQDNGAVIGILCEGNMDYEEDKNSGRSFTPHLVSSDEIRRMGYEKCQRINRLNELQDFIDCGLTRFTLDDMEDYLNYPKRSLSQGMSFLVKCLNHARPVTDWVSKGTGTFQLAKEAACTSCTICSQWMEVVSIAFSDCTYQIEGKLASHDRPIKKRGDSSNGKITAFDPDRTLIWDYLEMKVLSLQNDS